MYSACATSARRRQPEAVHQIPDDLGRARGAGDDVVERAEHRVVVVVIDVQQARAVAQHARGVAVDVAAVEEHDGALGDVRGRLLDEAVEREQAVLERQRQIVRGDEHLAVLAERAQQPLHRDERAERVAVGVLVRGQHEALVLAQAGEHQLARLLDRERVGHQLPISSISSSTRNARSVVSS